MEATDQEIQYGSTRSFAVKLLRKVVVRAPGDQLPREPHTLLPLSNLDYLYPCQVTLAYFYPKPAARGRTPLGSIAAALEWSLAAALRHFPHFAGRMVPHPETVQPGILCDNQGAEMIVVEVDVPLASLDLSQLDRSVEKIYHPPAAADTPLSVQLTGYACGGFSIFWTFHHMLADAAAFGVFLSVWSEVSRGGEGAEIIISRRPIHDRLQILSPRSPLSYGPLLDRLFVKCTPEDLVLPDASVSTKRVYYVEAAVVDRLRDLANSGGGGEGRRTRVEAFSAYLWKILARAASEPSARCALVWAVDGRPMMGSNGTSLSDYFGNLISPAAGEMNAGDLLQGSLAEVAGAVSRAIGGVKNKSHFLDLVDWVERHKPGFMVPRPTVDGGRCGPRVPPLLLSFCQHLLPVEEVELGEFGRPSLALFYSPIEKADGGLMHVSASPNGDGSWVLSAYVWPELAELLESSDDGDDLQAPGRGGRVFQRLHALHA